MKRRRQFQHTAARRRLELRQRYAAQFGGSFNTQPPEGGWVAEPRISALSRAFQHTAARRRLAPLPQACFLNFWVSTHSRPKAAGVGGFPSGLFVLVSTHSRPKAAGAWPESYKLSCRFQHTAARRRLEPAPFLNRAGNLVSTHSRPKAAGFRLVSSFLRG